MLEHDSPRLCIHLKRRLAVIVLKIEQVPRKLGAEVDSSSYQRNYCDTVDKPMRVTGVTIRAVPCG